MTNLVIDTLNNLLPTADPSLRTERLKILELEIVRAENGIFSDVTLMTPSEAYLETYQTAKDKHALATERQWVSLDTFQISEYWIALLGFRFAMEDDLLQGGIKAAQIRAAEILNYSPVEVYSWNINTLFDVYTNTTLQHEWQYDGKHFRFAA